MIALIQRFQRLRKEEKGITLVELLAVIVIIGVIAAIAVPLITGLLDDTKANARSATANQLYEAARLRSIAKNNGEITGTHKLSELVADKYIQSGLTDPKSGNTLADTTTVNLGATGTATVVTLVVTGGDTITFNATDLKNSKPGTKVP
ncbi:MAG: prepilin-type N-terminal cleavage/methylation domain-containing protein [Paenibacillaceae bacterium]|uniref:Prepilin-type N-terminal cleavage/methylation domain-containing protein n=1 Tax=Paenibacillus mellifer TaxID=2937794 RepID=A0A9X1Y0G9_9BACL|nr:prepilin-type N-terminal cleavage/methylation domain-containing protein [Paenibacillus mellifer]MBW4838315.1 prepilin-type N-terminal cleavage/methylation domain-containing protein [Paenibacillaceae bacterium]MCK8487346.1 prepilin-type N-terminal cleavage/methylation domain-containing protein [Paenibacillus mellifer]